MRRACRDQAGTSHQMGARFSFLGPTVAKLRSATAHVDHARSISTIGGPFADPAGASPRSRVVPATSLNAGDARANLPADSRHSSCKLRTLALVARALVIASRYFPGAVHRKPVNGSSTMASPTWRRLPSIPAMVPVPPIAVMMTVVAMVAIAGWLHQARLAGADTRLAGNDGCGLRRKGRPTNRDGTSQTREHCLA